MNMVFRGVEYSRALRIDIYEIESTMHDYLYL